MFNVGDIVRAKDQRVIQIIGNGQFTVLETITLEEVFQNIRINDQTSIEWWWYGFFELVENTISEKEKQENVLLWDKIAE